MGRNTSIKTSTTDNFTQLVDNINNQSIDVGATGKLTTTVDSDIVGAINELDSNMGAKTSLTTTNKTSIVNAINEIDSDLGQLSTLADDIRDSNFAISINNLNTNVNQLLGSLSGLDSAGGDSDTRRGGFDVAEQVTVVSALNALSQDIGKLDSDLNREARMTTTATTLRGAINELDSDIGARPHTSLNTTAKNLVGAINENLASLNALTVFKNFATDSGSISITVDSANDTLKLLSGSSLKTLGLAGTNTIQIDHDVTGASSVNNSGNTFIQDLTINADGHVTGIASATVDTVDSAGLQTQINDKQTQIDGKLDSALEKTSDSDMRIHFHTKTGNIFIGIGAGGVFAQQTVDSAGLVVTPLDSASYKPKVGFTNEYSAGGRSGVSAGGGHMHATGHDSDPSMNTIIGHRAGYAMRRTHNADAGGNNNDTRKNTIIGAYAFSDVGTRPEGSSIQYQSNQSFTWQETGEDNTIVGAGAGNSGTRAGGHAGNINACTIMGTNACDSAGITYESVIIGQRAGRKGGSYNVIIGSRAGGYGVASSSSSYTGYSDYPGSNNVIIGQSTYSVASNGGNTIIGRAAYVQGNNSYDCVVIGRSQGLTGDGNDRLKIGADGTTWIQGASNGVVSGDFNDTSDENLKENILSLDSGSGITIIKALKPRKFDWKPQLGHGDSDDSDRLNKIGFIAQEVETVIPTAVSGEDFETHTYYDSDDSEWKTQVMGKKSVNSTAIVSYLVKAIQEQQVIIDNLKSRIETIES